MATTALDALQLAASIASFKEEIAEHKTDLKTLREREQEILERVAQYQTVVELQEQLKQTKEKLRLTLLSNGTYNDLMEQIADKKKELSDAQFDLSEFLVAYFQQTGERQVELHNEAREVLLSGKLGKELPSIQTSIFSIKEEVDVGIDRKDLN